MSNSISYGLCARACTYLSLYIHWDCCAAHVYIFTRGALSEYLWGCPGLWLMTVMITKMGEGSTTGTVIIRRNLPGTSPRWSKSSSSQLFFFPGTKTANFSQWVEEPFDEMDSTLAVQQYIQQTIRRWDIWVWFLLRGIWRSALLNN